MAHPQCPRVSTPATARARDAAGNRAGACDYRDLPVALQVTAYNREALAGPAAAGELVVSPAPPAAVETTYLPRSVNVLTVGGRRGAGVLGRSDAHIAVDRGQPYGWIKARVQSADVNVQVCDWDFANDASSGFGASAGEALKDGMVCSALTGGVPVIGFTAWSRKVAANPDASYARIVEHSYGRDRVSVTPQAPGTVFRDSLKDGGQGPQMVVLPTGSFQMGSPSTETGRWDNEGPVRTVTISQRIAMGRYEVTFAEYDRFVAATSGRRPNDFGWGRGSRPVIDVSQEDAKAYATWLSEQTGKTPSTE